MTIASNVKDIIKNYPECTHNINALMVIYWATYDKINIEPSVAAEIISNGMTYEKIFSAIKKLREDGEI